MQKLYQHQLDFLTQNPNKSALVWSCGTGKTRAACEWSAWGCFNTLIICPKSLKTNWLRELNKWCPDNFSIVLTKEEFRRDYKILPKYDQIIVDEVHNGFLTPHFKSQMSKALRDYIKKHQVPRVLLLSATVYTSSPWNIFQLANLLGHKLDWMKFKYTFFTEIRMGPRMIAVPKKGCEAPLAKLTKQIASVVSLDECIDVPEQTFETEEFELTQEQNKMIENSYDPLPIVRFTQAHQISNGVLKGNEFKKDIPEIKSLKNDRILSLCEENDKLIIVCRYNLQIDYLKNLLKNYNVFVIRGDVKDRDTVVQNANKSDKAVVLVQSSCSMGYELSSFRIMVFASMDFSFAHYKQMTGRILRINNPQKNLYLHLISGESDKAIFDAISSKKDFDVSLFYEKQ